MLQRKPQPIRPQQVRLHRQEVMDQDEIREEEGNLWAVSYSDLLMVLMSFFIIFFSFNQNDNAISQIAIEMHKIVPENLRAKGLEGGGVKGGQPGHFGIDKKADTMTGPALGGHTGTGGGFGVVGRPAQGIDKGIPLPAFVKSLNISGVAYKLETNAVIIDLPDNIYPIRGTHLSGDSLVVFKELLKKLKAHSDKVDFYFVGHSDSVPVVHKTDAISNNYELSATRASKALGIALQQGLSPGSLFTTGSASNTRDSRTLSIKIKLKEKQP